MADTSSGSHGNDGTPSEGVGTSSGDLYTILTRNTTTEMPVARTNSCDMIDTDYNIPTSVVCAMCFVFGILYTFFGYRFFKAIMFLTGFMFASILVYMICLEEKVLTPAANAGIALGAGFLCGLLTMLVQYCGLFLTGFHSGISLAVTILIVLEQFIHPPTMWIPIGALAGTGIVFGLLTMKFQKSGTMFGTSIFGGVLMVSCVDYFIEKFVMMEYMWERVKTDVSPAPCWYSWVILMCWPFCFLVGLLTQWKITARGFNHKEVVHNRRTQNMNLKRSRTKEKTKENTHQSRYRHLYQIRRFNGDVISQNYMDTMQNKLSPSLRTLTPVSTEPQTEPESTNTTLTQIPEV